MKELGYDIASYNKREITQQFLKNGMQELLDNAELQSIDKLKKILIEIAVLERFRSAGVPERNIAHVRALMNQYIDLKRGSFAQAKVHETAVYGVECATLCVFG